jgi:hypothetical protein
LGIEVDPADEYEDDPYEDHWEARVAAVADAGLYRLVEAVRLPEVEIARMAAFALGYCEESGVLEAIRGLDVADQATRLALAMAVAMHGGSAEDRGGPEDPCTRFGLALGAVVRPRKGSTDNADSALTARSGTIADVVEALLLFAGPCGVALTRLPWADSDSSPDPATAAQRTAELPSSEDGASWWPGSADRALTLLRDLLPRQRPVHVQFLSAVAQRHPHVIPKLADSAASTGDPSLVEAYGTGLLEHARMPVRRFAVRRLTRGWRTPAYQEAVAALIDDPALGDDARVTLALVGDRRSLPWLITQLPRLERDRSQLFDPLGAELLPHLLPMLEEPTPPWLAVQRLIVAAAWGDPPLLARPETAALLARLTEQHLADPGNWEVLGPLQTLCQKAGGSGVLNAQLDERLRVMATSSSIWARQYAQFALLERDDTEWLTSVLVAEITNHPVRTGRSGPHNANHGWRADATACCWLGRIGAPAAGATPALRSMLAETGEAGDARPEAAEAYWRITGDVVTALTVLDALAEGPTTAARKDNSGQLFGGLAERARKAAATIRGEISQPGGESSAIGPEAPETDPVELI